MTKNKEAEKILVNNSDKFAFTVVRGNEFITVNPGKKMRVWKEQIEDVEKQIVNFPFMSLQDVSKESEVKTEDLAEEKAAEEVKKPAFKKSSKNKKDSISSEILGSFGI